MHIYCQLIN